MKHQDQKPRETSASQLPQCTEERQEKRCASRPYCPPQVFLVGDAKCLTAGGNYGDYYDNQKGYYYY